MWVIWDLIMLYPEINKYMLLKVSYWCHLNKITLPRLMMQTWTHQVWLEEKPNPSEQSWYFAVVYLPHLHLHPSPISPACLHLAAFAHLQISIEHFFFFNLQEEMQIAQMQMLVVTRSYMQKHDIGLWYRTIMSVRMTNDTHIVKMLHLFCHNSPCGHSYSEINTFCFQFR